MIGIRARPRSQQDRAYLGYPFCRRRRRAYWAVRVREEIHTRLREAIALVLDEALTYREIAMRLNERGLYHTANGMYVPTELVRVTVKASQKFFRVDRTQVPHRVSLVRVEPKGDSTAHP